MKRVTRLVLAAATLVATAGLAAPHGAVASSNSIPPWVRHVMNYPGGISNGVRAYLDKDLIAAQKQYAASARSAPGQPDGSNQQLNDDSTPPLPQDETAVASNPRHQNIAVAASNDYVSGGVWIGRTLDGGQTWQTTTRITPQFFPFRAFCNGGDPALAYSIRDRAFYLAQLCFFRTEPESEVHVYKSLDNGLTWTPSRLAAVAASNFDPATGLTDASILNDKEEIVVDNNSTSPFFGRIYVTWTKFHIDLTDPKGRSDYCPIQLAYTDKIPTKNPQLTVWNHTPVVPDMPENPPKGEGANQHSHPAIEADGTLDVTYVLEDCNSGIDRHLKLQKSTDGGASFLPDPIQIDKKGQFVDNPDPGDLLGPTFFRAPISPSFVINPVTGTLNYVYLNYVDGANSGANISLSRSFDGGLHWTSSQFISTQPDGSPAPNDQFFPWIDADPAGNLFAIWFDRRNDPNNHDIETFEGVSANDGASWSNTDISTAAWNPDEGFFTSGAFIGDYNGLAASSVAIYPVWTDGRDSAFGVTGIGETDIWSDVELR